MNAQQTNLEQIRAGGTYARLARRVNHAATEYIDVEIAEAAGDTVHLAPRDPDTDWPTTAFTLTWDDQLRQFRRITYLPTVVYGLFPGDHPETAADRYRRAVHALADASLDLTEMSLADFDHTDLQALVDAVTGAAAHVGIAAADLRDALDRYGMDCSQVVDD